MAEDILERINKAGLKFLGPLSLQEAYELTVQEAARLLGADWSFLYLAEKNKLKRVAVYPTRGTEMYAPRKNGFTYRAYKEQKTFFIPAPILQKEHPELSGRNYGCAICLPISDHKQAIGALTLFTHGNRTYTRREQRAIEVFGSYASLAIRKAQLFEQIQEALLIRDHFISLAAHELRTPLTSITGYIQLLEAKLGSGKNKEARWINALVQESTRLTQLVSELLQINRLKAGQLNFTWETCSLEKILQDALAKFTALHPTHKVIVKGDWGKNDTIIADFNKLRQVFINILDNGAKFSSPNSTIVASRLYKKPHFVLRFQDEGEGITKEDLRRVFEGFYKGGGNVKGGMGLGLLFARHVVHNHNGTISVRSEVRKGTMFEIKLPVAKV